MFWGIDDQAKLQNIIHIICIIICILSNCYWEGACATVLSLSLHYKCWCHKQKSFSRIPMEHGASSPGSSRNVVRTHLGGPLDCSVYKVMFFNKFSGLLSRALFQNKFLLKVQMGIMGLFTDHPTPPTTSRFLLKTLLIGRSQMRVLAFRAPSPSPPHTVHFCWQIWVHPEPPDICRVTFVLHPPTHPTQHVEHCWENRIV